MLYGRKRDDRKLMTIRVLIKKTLFSLLSTWLIVRVSRKDRRIALTFDDGPDPLFTPSVLLLLKESRAKATFFLLGSKVDSFPDLARQIVDEGHEIASHSFEHHPLKGKSYTELTEELGRADTSLKPFCNGNAPLLRPPYGTVSISLLVWAWRHRRKIVLWSLDPEDFCAENVLEPLRFFKEHPIAPGDIILLHDQSNITVDLLETLLPELQKDGFQMVSVTDLLEGK
jgi:peptidoglycan/xylan/chitin deacetylase (PgdA/CDA1 family)